jgi:hypothetical protein
MNMESHDGIILTGEFQRTGTETCPSDTLSTTNPTWTDPGANPGLRGERPAMSQVHSNVPLHLEFIKCSGMKYFDVTTPTQFSRPVRNEPYIVFVRLTETFISRSPKPQSPFPRM